MPDPTTLSEKNRAKLDGIVQQMISNNESEDNINFVVNDFKNKYSEKKNPVSSTSKDTKSDLAPKTGSLAGKNTQGFPEIDSNGIAPNYEQMKPAEENPIGKEKRLRKELANVKVTPENMDEVTAKTDALSATIKSNQAVKDQAKSKRVKELETSFYDATRNNNDDAVAEQRLNDVVNTNGIWNNVKSIAKKSYNTVVDAVSATSPTLIGLQSAKVNTDPLADEKKQAKQEALKNKENLSDVEITQRAKELFKEKEKENLYLDRANSFLDNMDSEDKDLLKQNRYDKVIHLQEDNLKRLKYNAALRTLADDKIADYKKVESQLQKLKENGEAFPEDLYAQYTSLSAEIQKLGSSLNKNEAYVLNNKKDLGTAEQEFDLFKREYGDLYNFAANISNSAGELAVNTLSGLEYIGTLGGNLDPGNKNKGVQEDLNAIGDYFKNERGNLRKPVESVESVEGFVNYTSDLLANQIPNLVATSTGAKGLAMIGTASAGQKFTEMNSEVRQGKAKYSPLQMAVAPLLYGGAEVVSEIPTLSILKKGGRVFESIAKNEAELLTKTAKQKAVEWAKDYGVDMSKEMAGEQFTNFAQNFNNKYVLGKKEVNLLDNTGQVFKDTFTLTSILKATPQTFGVIAKVFQTKSDLGTLDENSRKIIEFSKQLNTEGLTDTEKTVIQKQIDKVTSESSKIVNNTIGKISDMPGELYDEVVSLNSKAGEIKSQATAINDGNLSNKEELLKGLAEDYKALQEKRNGIIEGKTTVVDVLPLKEQETLKKQAMEALVTELNPDGKKNITITNEQVVERANEIYNESKKNENETATTPEAQPQAEVQKPSEAEKVDELRDSPKISQNQEVSPVEDVVASSVEESKNQKNSFGNSLPVGHKRFDIITNGKIGGEIVVSSKKINEDSKDTDYYEVVNSSVSEQNKGIGTNAYKVLINQLDKPLRSDMVRTPQAEKVWQKLEKEGLAKKTEDGLSYESIPPTNTPADGNVSVGDKPNDAQGKVDEVPKAIDAKPSEGEIKIATKKVKSVKDGEYDVDFDEKGNVVEIRSPKDGRKIEKFVERKVKPSKQNPTGKILSKNANYAKIEADAKDELSQNEKNNLEKEAQKIQDEKIRAFEPNDEYELALKYVAEGGKVKLSSARNETGEKNAKAMKWAAGFNKEADLPSIENVAEKLIPYDSNLKESKIREALIDIYSTFESQNDVKKHLLEVYEENNAKKEEEELRAHIGQLSEKDFAIYQAIQAEEGYFSELSEKEVEEYYNQKLDEYEQGQQEYARAETANQGAKDIAKSNEAEVGSENQNGNPEGEENGGGIGEVSNEQNRNNKLARERVQYEKITPKNAPKKLQQIIKDVANGLKSHVIYSRSKRSNTLGSYNPRNTLVRITKAGDIDTVAHELGHLLDDRLNILGTIPAADKVKIDAQFKWYSDRGGSNPPAKYNAAQKAEYLEREGLAEFIRSYVANPSQTKILAPELLAHFEKTIDPKTQTVLTKFSEDYLDFANASGIEKTLSNIEEIDLPNKNKFVEWIKGFRQGDDKLKFTKMDKFYAEMANSNHFGIKAFKALLNIQGKTDLKSHENFEIVSRVFLGVNGKLENVFSTGMINAKNEKLKSEGGVFDKDNKGRTVYKDGTAMNVKWLIDGLDTTTEESLKKDMGDVIAMAVAERTIEYAKKFERSDNLTGIGGSVETDLTTAVTTLNEFKDLEKNDKAKFDRIQEGVKRYRQMADATLQYAADKGRISKEQLEQIKQGNEYYVSLNRNKELEPGEDLFSSFNTGTNGIGAAKEIIKKSKGGTATIENPYLSLLKNMNNIIKEADRNEVMLSFVEPLISTRTMGEGEPVDLSKIGFIANEGDAETIKVFRDGKLEKWKFDKDIYSSLKNIESIASNPIFTFLSKPSQLIRWTVTHNPVFYARNIVKDTQARMIVSNDHSSFKDMIHNSGDKELFELFGGSQAGHLHTSKESYAKTMQGTIKEITKKGGIVINPIKLGQKYVKFLQTGENLNRIAEFNNSYKVAKEKGMSDYDAGLYAAFQARDLMDFAVAGHTMREINKIVVFSNAGVQSLRKASKSLKKDPAGFAYRTALYSVLPSVAFAALRNAMGDDEEYEDLPDNQRDMFFNFKTPVTGDAWVSIPKPYELGLFSAYVDRGISKIRGNNEAFDGVTGTTMKLLLPFDESSFLGGLKPIIETGFNRDIYTDRSIVPEWESGKLLELRKGTDKASLVGQKMSKLFNEAGWSVDPRKIDHILKGYGTYFANQGMAISDLAKKDRAQLNFWITKTGFAKDIPTYNSKSVKKATDLAVELGKINSGRMKGLRNDIEAFYSETDIKKRKELLNTIYKKSKEISDYYEKEKVKTLDKISKEKE
jgi:hypothetical protein